jgi:hypothetical protein
LTHPFWQIIMPLPARRITSIVSRKRQLTPNNHVSETDWTLTLSDGEKFMSKVALLASWFALRVWWGEWRLKFFIGQRPYNLDRQFLFEILVYRQRTLYETNDLPSSMETMLLDRSFVTGLPTSDHCRRAFSQAGSSTPIFCCRAKRLPLAQSLT